MKKNKTLLLSLLGLAIGFSTQVKAEDIDFSPRNNTSDTNYNSTSSSEFDNLNSYQSYSNTTNTGGQVNSFDNLAVDQNGQVLPEKKEVKTVKIDVTQQKHFKLKKTSSSVYHYVNKTAKQNGHQVIWLLNQGGGLKKENMLLSDFFTENHSWQAKIATAIKHYNDNSFRSKASGTEINVYQCSNNKILVSEVKDVSRLYITYKISDCEILIPIEETKTYINGKELAKDAVLEEELKKVKKEMAEDAEKNKNQTEKDNSENNIDLVSPSKQTVMDEIKAEETENSSQTREPNE